MFFPSSPACRYASVQRVIRKWKFFPRPVQSTCRNRTPSIIHDTELIILIYQPRKRKRRGFNFHCVSTLFALYLCERALVHVNVCIPLTRFYYRLFAAVVCVSAHQQVEFLIWAFYTRSHDLQYIFPMPSWTFILHTIIDTYKLQHKHMPLGLRWMCQSCHRKLLFWLSWHMNETTTWQVEMLIIIFIERC